MQKLLHNFLGCACTHVRMYKTDVKLKFAYSKNFIQVQLCAPFARIRNLVMPISNQTKKPYYFSSLGHIAVLGPRNGSSLSSAVLAFLFRVAPHSLHII